MFLGKVKVHKRWDDEKELITRFAQPGDIIGHLGLGNDPVYPVSATAIEQSMVCYIALPFFESTLNVILLPYKNWQEINFDLSEQMQTPIFIG